MRWCNHSRKFVKCSSEDISNFSIHRLIGARCIQSRNRLTKVQAGQIKFLAQTTDLMQHEIAAKLGINQGRVSEVLNGKRFHDVLPIPFV